MLYPMPALFPALSAALLLSSAASAIRVSVLNSSSQKLTDMGFLARLAEESHQSRHQRRLSALEKERVNAKKRAKKAVSQKSMASLLKQAKVERAASAVQEGGRFPFCVSQEKFPTGFLKNARSILETF